MDIKKEDPSKVIIIPRPPRCMNPELVPIDQNEEAPEAVDEAEEEEAPVVPPVALDGPGIGPMNNQVEGPAQGLAGEPKK